MMKGQRFYFESENSGGFSRTGLILMAGFAVIFIGILLMVVASLFGEGGSSSTGIVIFIGPFPVVIGAGPDALWLILIGVIIAVAMAVMFVIYRRRIGFGL